VGITTTKKEMIQSYDALKKVQQGLKGSLQNPNISEDVRKYLQELLDITNYYIEKIESIFNPFGGVNANR